LESPGTGKRITRNVVDGECLARFVHAEEVPVAQRGVILRGRCHRRNERRAELRVRGPYVDEAAFAMKKTINRRPKTQTAPPAPGFLADALQSAPEESGGAGNTPLSGWEVRVLPSSSQPIVLVGRRE